MMFRPPGSNSNWVPLRRLDWSFSIWAQVVNGTWTVVSKTQAMTPPSGVFARETTEPVWDHFIQINSSNWIAD